MTTPDGAAGGKGPGSSGSPPDGELDSFMTAVLAASWLLVGISTRTVEEVDERITLTQFRTLAVLAARGRTNLSRLAAELDVNASTAMRVIDRLVVTKLVSRTENPASRREVVLCLTPMGEQLVVDVIAKRRLEIAKLLEVIPAAERAALVSCLQSFTAAAERVGLRPAAPASLGW